MASQPVLRFTPEQYLEIERAAATRSEYLNGEMFAMAGGSFRQSAIVASLARRLGNALEGKGCFVLVQDMRTRTAYDGLYTYPDVSVVCGKPQFADQRQDVLTNPTLIIEVLSPSTEGYDRGAKFAQYRQVESLREYVLIAQNEPRVEVFRKQPSGQWLLFEFTGSDATAVFESIGCSLALEEIYANTDPDAAGA